jgi:DNA transformation protein and related proteins
VQVEPVAVKIYRREVRPERGDFADSAVRNLYVSSAKLALQSCNRRLAYLSPGSCIAVGIAMPRSTATEFTQAKSRPPGADFADYCCELISSLGSVQAKRMFLGWGLSVDGLTVAVIAYDTLYLKANAATQGHFVAAGCQIFEHEANGRKRQMLYHTAPESALESRAAMQPWAALAMQAAVAARKPEKAAKRSAATKAESVTKPRKLGTKPASAKK